MNGALVFSTPADRHVVRRFGWQRTVTRRQFAILQTLHDAGSEFVPHAGFAHVSKSRSTIRTFVSDLRPIIAGLHARIVNVPGKGFRLVLDPVPSDGAEASNMIGASC